MATNLLGRPVRLRERPTQCAFDEGSIAAVSIDDQGYHFLVLLDRRLILVDKPSDLLVLD
jgi:hypothetical protein